MGKLKLSPFPSLSPLPPLFLLLVLLLVAATGVETFSLNRSSGVLTVELNRPCYAKYYDDAVAFFNRSIRGNLSFGALRGVEGLAQEELFVWLPVKGILVSDPTSGVILFDIGLAHKRLSRSLFDDPPTVAPMVSKLKKTQF
uniref:Xylanase inhibitor C-terminal domain-containing protein n=1 Tax=Ananas comosus var. bracteatus TaxID=296719 RepID=A0A6V7QE80_ANACO|nr:unnamed protein product [Ananas comosus var. bracteatus]